MRRFISSICILVFIHVIVSAQSYSRIVSLAPSLTKNVYYLESQRKLVGCTSYCEMAKPDNKEIVASAVNVNIEKVVSLKPDLILVTTITNPETIEQIKKFGISVEVFPTPKSFEEICNQFMQIGSLLGKKTKAEEIIRDTRSRVDSIKKQFMGKEQPKVFFQIGAKPLFTVIPETFMNDYITFVNGQNIVTETKRGTIARESVIARNPDYIFVTTMGIMGEEETKVWKTFSNINATKNDHVFIIDSDLACTPTPVTFIQTLEIISKHINK